MQEVWDVMARALRDVPAGYKPYDKCVRITVALNQAGFRIVRKPKRQQTP